MRRYVRAILCIPMVVAATVAEAVEVRVVDTPGPVGWISETSAGVYARIANGVFRLEACANAGVCLRRAAIEGALRNAPDEGLPDGKVATASKGDLAKAWYGRPTRRYRHGVLGDDIEGGSILAEDFDGGRYELVLDRSFVFEDITPRLFDLDRDGRNEIVAICSSLDKGAAIAVHGLRDGALKLLAKTKEIGRSNRWLNIAGIGDFSGAGVNAIAWVETPHIGGILRMGVFDGQKIKILSNGHNGFSNHFIGSRELDLSASGDFDGDGVTDLAIPSADREKMIIATRLGLTSIRLPVRIGHAVATVGNAIVTAGTDGRLMVIHP